MANELPSQMEGLQLTNPTGTSDSAVVGVEGSFLRSMATRFYRRCIEENESRSRKHKKDPVEAALNVVEEIVIGIEIENRSRASAYLQMCKFVNSMSLNELSKYNDKLVRFRGMIQEIYDPIMYRAEGNVIEQDGTVRQDCFIYRDEFDVGTVLDPKEENDHKKFRDLEMFHVISVPGENQWIKELAYDLPRSKVYQDNGRKFDEFNSIAQRDTTFAFPIPEMYEDDMLKACIVKSYKTPSGLKINQVFDFFGILSLHTETDERPAHNDEFEKANDEEAERMIRDPRPRFVPRFNCIFAIPVYSEKILEIIPRAGLCNVEKYFRLLEKLLLNIFQGDELVVKYLMFNLVSGVETRVGSTPVGSFPVMISDMRTNLTGSQFSELIEAVVPKSYFISNLQTMAETYTFTPKKDFRSNKLTGGLLQLSDGTQLIVQDLTRTNDIQNSGKGPTSLAAKQNLQALEKLIEWQTVNYDYKYNQMEINHDIPIVILSRSRNLFESHFLPVVPWCPEKNDTDMEEKSCQFLKLCLNHVSSMHGIRLILETVKAKKCQPIPENVNDLIAADFVASRQNNDPSKHLSEGDFNRCLTMTKYFAKLYNAGTITYDVWKRVRSLESERKRRLAEIQCIN